MSNAWQDWDRVRARIYELWPNWTIIAIHWDGQEYQVVCEHGLEILTPGSLSHSRSYQEAKQKGEI